MHEEPLDDEHEEPTNNCNDQSNKHTYPKNETTLMQLCMTTQSV